LAPVPQEAILAPRDAIYSHVSKAGAIAECRVLNIRNWRISRWRAKHAKSDVVALPTGKKWHAGQIRPASDNGNSEPLFAIAAHSIKAAHVPHNPSFNVPQ
jgi:hypothetical protein